MTRRTMHRTPLEPRTMGGHPKYAPAGEPLRFCQEVALRYQGDECLKWPYAREADGYGHVWRDGRAHGAHRVICEMAHGTPPTNKHYAAHSCGKGHEGCVNPRHLRWATPAENVADRKKHGTHICGEGSYCAKLTERQVREIYSLKGKLLQREIANQYGVATFTVSQIHRGRKWAHLGLNAELGFTVTFTEPAHTAAEGLASPASVADEQPANTKDALKPSNENFATVPHMGPVT